MRTSIKSVLKCGVAVSLALTLAGCGDTYRKTFGLEANPPDAYEVGTQAPLSLPPELGQLPAPNPGQPRPQQIDAAQQGQDALTPAAALTAAPAVNSPGQQALLDQAGPPPPADIRAQVNQTALIDSRSPGFVSSVMGASSKEPPTVDASAESRRLQENAAMGQPVTAGQTPQTDNSKPGWFQSFLNIF